MVTNYLTAHTISGHDPPASTRTRTHACGSRVDHQALYPPKADNLSATHSTYKGINHGKAT